MKLHDRLIVNHFFILNIFNYNVEKFKASFYFVFAFFLTVWNSVFRRNIYRVRIGSYALYGYRAKQNFQAYDVFLI